MVKISHFKIAMGFFGKIWENISISLPRTIPAVYHVRSCKIAYDIDGLVQDCSNSIAKAV